MKTLYIVYLTCLLSLLAQFPAVANDKARKGQPDHKETVEQPGVPEANAKEPSLRVKVVISEDERRIIQGYADHGHNPGKPGRKGKGLPPGLAKKAARGEELPPGWQSRCAKDQTMPVEVYERAHPLPPEIVVKLPTPPPGTILIAVEGKVARLVKATHEILDVFDIRF